METTFKEIEKNSSIDKEVKKAGLSLAIIFNKEECKKYGLKYGTLIRLNDAKIISKETKDI